MTVFENELKTNMQVYEVQIVSTEFKMNNSGRFNSIVRQRFSAIFAKLGVVIGMLTSHVSGQRYTKK